MSKDTGVKNKKSAACEEKVRLVKPPRKNTKTAYIWRLLSDGTGLNRLQAAVLGEHHLSATVSNLRASGRLISDEWEVIRTLPGPSFCVKRYWATRG